MNVKKLIVTCVMTAALVIPAIPCFGQTQDVEDQTSTVTMLETPDSMNFEYTAIIGTVVDENKKPIANLRLEVELAPERELRNEISVGPAQLTGIINGLKQSVGKGIFATTNTSETGEYKIKGVPIPGIYYLYVRNSANYFPTRLKISLDASPKKEFKLQEMVVNTRETPVKVIAEKALKEMDKSRKALMEKDIKAAIKCIQKALEIEPEYADGYYNLAILYMESKDMNEAVKHLENAIKFEKDHKLALQTLGDIYLFKKEYEKAVNCFTSYLALREKEGNLTAEDAKTYFQTGNSLKALKKIDESIPYFEKYLDAKQKAGALEQKDSLIANDTGSYFYSKNNLEKAIVYYAKAVELNPGITPETYMYLGNAYVGRRDGANAIKCYEKYIELDPKGKFIAQVKAMLDKLKAMYKQQ